MQFVLLFAHFELEGAQDCGKGGSCLTPWRKLTSWHSYEQIQLKHDEMSLPVRSHCCPIAVRDRIMVRERALLNMTVG